MFALVITPASVALLNLNCSAAFTRLSAKRHLDQPFDGWEVRGRLTRRAFQRPYSAWLEPMGAEMAQAEFNKRVETRWINFSDAFPTVKRLVYAPCGKAA